MKKKLHGDFIGTRVTVNVETWEVIQDIALAQKKRTSMNVSYAAIVRSILNTALGLDHLVEFDYRGPGK